MVVVMIMMVLRNSDHPFDAADDTPGHSTDGAANRCANRTGCASAFGRSSFAALDYALSLCDEGHRQDGSNAKEASGYSRPNFHG